MPNQTNHLEQALDHLRSGAWGDAESTLRDLVKQRPPDAATLNLLGVALQQQMRLDEAAEAMAEACRVAPDNAEFHSNLAATFILGRRFTDAEAAARKATSLAPERADAHANLGTALRRQGRLEEAAASFRLAAQLRPDFPSYRTNLGDMLQQLGRIDEAIAELTAVVDAAPDNLKARSDLIMTLNYSDAVSGTDLSRESRAFGEVAGRKAAGRVLDARPKRTAGSPLRIGFVSGDLRHHAVAQFLLGALPALTGAGHLLFAYATRDAADDVTVRLRSRFVGWRDITRISDRAAAKAIADDGIHVLVDLSGHSGANRLPVFAYRPAPVMATWLGYSGTTGLAEMDYILADAHVLPLADEACFSERPMRLPECYLLFSEPSAPDVPPVPALTRGHVTFGSFNNLGKLSGATIKLWSRVLHGVPDGRLVLKSPTLGAQQARQLISGRFAAHGVDADRIDVLGRVADVGGHLRAYGEIDICLDPFPYAGTTTTCEALWMGRPVITLEGDRFTARVGASLLRTVGLGDWVAGSEAEYLAMATARAADIGALTDLSQRLRSRMRTSPLMDRDRFAANIVAAFETMWAERGTKD